MQKNLARVLWRAARRLLVNSPNEKMLPKQKTADTSCANKWTRVGDGNCHGGGGVTASTGAGECCLCANIVAISR